jgi:hypothetical protein
MEKTVTEPPANEGGAASEAGGDGGGASSRGGDKVPDLVGERLDVAEDELDELGISYEEVGGGTFGIVVRSNWEVCETRPKAGATANRVKLIVDRPGNC